MEVGRRSLNSENEFCKRSSKKMGAPPLAMILSFNEKDVHPDCPNASNPYHKCGQQCVEKIPPGKIFLDAIRSDEDREWEKKSGRQGVNPNCPYASNPYHKCAEYCLEKLPEKRHDAEKDGSGINPKEEKKEFFTTERGVKPACIYASNPYHVCAEYCYQTVPGKDLPGKSMRLKVSKAGEKVLSTKEKTSFHPQCKHASNPHHECSESCFQRVTDRKVAKEEKPNGVPNKTNKHLNRNASSHNKVTEYSFEDNPKKDHLKRGMKPKKENKIDITTQRGFSFEDNNTSSPYHACVEHCFESVPEKEQHGKVEKSKEESEIIATTEQRENFEYKNESNPSHLCPEYCSENMSEMNSHEQDIRLKSTKEGDKLLNNNQETCFDPQCKHASTLHHECTEFCFKNTTDRNLAEEENSEGVCMETDKHVHSSRPKHESSPYNKVTEYYFEDTSEKEQPEGAINPKEESEIVSIAEHGVNLECKSASNIDHVRAEYCFQSVPERERHGQKKPKGVSFKIDERNVLLNHKHVSNPYEEVVEHCFDDNPEKEYPNGDMKLKGGRMVVTAKLGVNLVCKYTSNPYHECSEYCFENLPMKDQLGKVLRKPKDKKVVVPLERVNPQCKHASNPYHVCAEYCFQNVSNGHHPGRPMMKSKEEKKVVGPPQAVNLDCKNESNPYHVCAEYCFENVLEKDPPKQTIKKLKEEGMVVLPSERRVSPECKFASNPYHVCVEYCLQNALEREQHEHVMKLKSLKELKNLVSNKKITSGQSQCEYASNPYHQCAEYCFHKNIPGSKLPVVKTNERKKEKSYAPRRHDNPKYKNGSNSFHRCAEYCPEEISPNNEAVEGSTVKEKKRNSSKENKRNHPNVEKDGTEKSIMDSKYVEAFDPTNNNFNANYRISICMQDGTKELQSDASDLFHEWAKYCSQTKVAEDEIVKQEKKVGMGELTRRNGEGNGILKDYDDSANMEKVQATGGFPRSLPISLLFLLGFLLALLHWSRVIHSLAMSSEKNEEPQRMKHERHLDPKCKKAHDPHHKCSRCCFPGVGEEGH